MKTTPHKEFGKTKLVPVNVFQNGEKIESDVWDEVLWVERGEDWYAFGNPQLRNKKVLVVEREVWLRCKEVTQ